LDCSCLLTTRDDDTTETESAVFTAQSALKCADFNINFGIFPQKIAPDFTLGKSYIVPPHRQYPETPSETLASPLLLSAIKFMYLFVNSTEIKQLKQYSKRAEQDSKA